MPLHDLESPLPGTFYCRPAPDAPLFKDAGQAVAVGDVLGLVEVMKQFSEITAEVAGTLQAFLVADGDAIEPGQVLLRIQTA